MAQVLASGDWSRIARGSITGFFFVQFSVTGKAVWRGT
jgi:hypothetical protein